MSIIYKHELDDDGYVDDIYRNEFSFEVSEHPLSLEDLRVAFESRVIQTDDFENLKKYMQPNTSLGLEYLQVAVTTNVISFQCARDLALWQIRRARRANITRQLQKRNYPNYENKASASDEFKECDLLDLKKSTVKSKSDRFEKGKCRKVGAHAPFQNLGKAEYKKLNLIHV